MQSLSLRNKRICLLIAHPDDEAMFFAPTLLALTQHGTGNTVKILCLSSGDADGLGDIRKKELIESGLMLGLRRAEDITIVDRPHISTLLSATFVQDDPSDGAAIDALITFDAHGVSGHPNHSSLYHGAKAFVAALVHGEPGQSSHIDLYCLKSVSLLRKYMSALDALTTFAIAWGRGVGPGDKHVAHPDGLVFMAGLYGPGGVSKAWQAMTRAHRSQMVWFRYGWIALSRYMVVNDLWLENKPGSHI
ncbi:putative deacetylase LmbE-like domain-containing protein [Stachybotrys elegans]|uniref:N-acetylglucosaminylphosphatidylinositol deacetylase n=1 Tax=Stachybotrys elegans TaxID=80388 RepID=A0A8K0WN10_9HYPO|nr:putative deacetylase LmbE-like domain-containing protein [Stachybotrys elegans]